MSSGGATTSTVLRVVEIGGKGRGLVATEPLRAGQVVLRDSPLLLYAASPFISSAASPYCGHCFRLLTSSSQKCSSCSLVFFCSLNCLASHTPWLCESLRRLHHCSATVFSDQPPERQVEARFLIAAYNLAMVSPSDFQVLICLQGRGGDSPSPADVAAAGFLHSLLASVCPATSVSISPELAVALITKDKLNSFCLMEPFSPLKEKRSFRAYGLYPKASLFNHDCLPNACWFDYVDSTSDDNTDIIIRMIHDVPEGREVCISYFRLNMNYSSRQRRLLEDYGFTCDCDRCKIEASWSVDEGKKNDSNFPHTCFLSRYICNGENCGGTLAPLPPTEGSAAPTTVLECSVCGNLKEDEVGDNH